MKSNELKEVEFIKALLRKGADRKTILQEFAKVYKNRSIKTVDNRLKVARKSIEGDIKIINQRTEESITKEVEGRKLEIMSIAERVDYLVKTLKGEITTPIPITQNGKIVEYKLQPSHRDRLSAIAELNKMDGSYAPTKTDVNVTEMPTPTIVLKK